MVILLVSEELVNGYKSRQTQWTDSIAVGSVNFVKKIKSELGVLAQGRKILKQGDIFQLREEPGTYIANFDRKNNDICTGNAYCGQINE